MYYQQLGRSNYAWVYVHKYMGVNNLCCEIKINRPLSSYTDGLELIIHITFNLE